MSGGYGGGAGGGEGDWYYSGAPGFLSIDVDTGDQFLLWANDAGPSIGGPGTLTLIQNSGQAGIYLAEATGPGTIVITENGCNFGMLVAHKLLVPIILG